jgi:hypothetical protein
MYSNKVKKCFGETTIEMIVVSAYELVKLIDDNVLRIPYLKQRGSEWSGESYYKWANTLVRMGTNYSSTLPNILIADVIDDIHVYQVITPVYSLGSNGFAISDNMDPQLLVYDGAQRISSMYSYFKGHYERERVTNDSEIISSSLSFKILKRFPVESEELMFSISTRNGIVKQNGLIDFHWILGEMIKHIKGDLSILDLTEKISDLYEEKGMDHDIDIIRENLILIKNSPFFEQKIPLSVERMSSGMMVTAFNTYNKYRGKALTSSSYLWIDICDSIASKYRRPLEAAIKVSEMSSWFEDRGLIKNHFSRVFVNINSDVMVKSSISSRLFENAKNFNRLSIEQTYEFVKYVEKTLSESGIDDFKRIWNKAYLSMNLMYGFWLHRDDIIGFYNDSLPYINRWWGEHMKYTDRQYKQKRINLDNGVKEWWIV